MTTSPTRYCHPCAALVPSVRTVAVKRVRIGGGSEVNTGRLGKGQTATGGKITNVCQTHLDSTIVTRAMVAGSGHAARQAAEVGAFGAEVVATATAEAARLMVQRARGLDMLTPANLSKIIASSRRLATCDTERDAAYDEIIDAIMRRVGEQTWRGDTVDVDRVVEVACFSNTSERARRTNLRIDSTDDEGNASSLPDGDPCTVDAYPSDDDDTVAWHGMTWTRAELDAMARQHPALAAAAGY